MKISMNYTREASIVEKLKQIQDAYEKQKSETELKKKMLKETKLTGKKVSMFLKFKLSVPCQGCHR